MNNIKIYDDIKKVMDKYGFKAYYPVSIEVTFPPECWENGQSNAVDIRISAIIQNKKEN